MCVHAIGSVVNCDTSVPFHTRQTELVPRVPSCVPPPCSLDAHINPGLGGSAQEAVSASLRHLFIASQSNKHHFQRGTFQWNKYAVAKQGCVVFLLF